MENLCDIRIVTSGPYNHNHAYPTCRTWSRDGRFLFFESNGPNPDGKVEKGRLHIQAADVETGEIHHIVTIIDSEGGGGGGCYQFDYAPLANCFVYIDLSSHFIHILNPDSMKSNMVIHEPEGIICGPPTISHDGRRIAYWAMMPSIANRFFDSYTTVIFAADIDPVECRLMRGPWIVQAYPRRKGKNYAENPRDGIHVNHPQINPKNKEHICYSHEMLGATPDGSVDMCRLWSVMADGDCNRYLVRQKAGLHFTHEVIAPDGKSLIFPYMHGVGQVDFDTLEVRSIYYNPHCCPGHLTVSPDMKWITGDTWGPDCKDEHGNPIQSIMLFDVETRRHANLCWIPRSHGHPEHPHPNFSPDGTKIAFTCLVDGYAQVAYIDVRDVVDNRDDLALNPAMKAPSDPNLGP